MCLTDVTGWFTQVPLAVGGPFHAPSIQPGGNIGNDFEGRKEGISLIPGSQLDWLDGIASVLFF